MLSSSSSAQSQAAGPDSSSCHSPALLGSQGSGVVGSQTRGSVVMLVGLTVGWEHGADGWGPQPGWCQTVDGSRRPRPDLP